MDKLEKEIWDKHSFKYEFEDGSLRAMESPAFRRAITDYNAEHKCCNCKKENCVKIGSSAMYRCYTQNCEIATLEVKTSDSNFSPNCFTNLFEMKESE